MLEDKTTKYLQTKIWYRFFKVIYIFGFIGMLFFWNIVIYSSFGDFFKQTILYFFIGNIVIILIFEIIKRAFYYVILGKIYPKK
ncbi:hypothetical protein IID20_03050 [Patescibacteria group bacterium]|nr:hypothetical protein [Patescibacteria group bacterium]